LGLISPICRIQWTFTTLSFNVQGISISGFHKNILINKELNFHNYVNNKKERKGKMIEKDERRKN